MVMMLLLICSACQQDNYNDLTSEVELSTGITTQGIAEPAPPSVMQPTDDGSQIIKNESPAQQNYIDAYTGFLLNSDIADNDFSDGLFTYGIYLVDLNFDAIPELCVRRESGGSMGGYFIYYCFDGKEIVPVLNEQNEPARNSSYTQILADAESERVFLLKEMYLLQGNVNGTYGYIREVKDQNGMPCVQDFLDLEVDQEKAYEIDGEMDYLHEDDYLSAVELDDYLITRCFSGGNWVEISSDEYLEQKRATIPEDNDFIDLLGTEMNIIIYESNTDMWDSDLQFVSKWITKEDIDMLFSEWLSYTG